RRLEAHHHLVRFCETEFLAGQPLHCPGIVLEGIDGCLQLTPKFLLFNNPGLLQQEFFAIPLVLLDERQIPPVENVRHGDQEKEKHRELVEFAPDAQVDVHRCAELTKLSPGREEENVACEAAARDFNLSKEEAPA